MKSQLTKRGRGRELAVVLHGPHGSPKEMQGVSEAIGERSEDLDILAPILPYGGFFGLFRTTPVEQIVRAVVEEIDKALANRERRGDGGAVARQSGWKRCGEQDGQFGGRGEEMIVAPRQ